MKQPRPHPDNANQPPQTEQERRDHYADGPIVSNMADQCACGAWRIDVWDGEEQEGWTITQDGDGLCAKCQEAGELWDREHKEYVTPRTAPDNERSGPPQTKGENDGRRPLH